MSWFFFSLLAGFAFAASRGVARFVLREKGSVLAFTAVHDVLAGLVLLPFIGWQLHLPTEASTWLFFCFFVVVAFLSDWTAFMTLKYIGISLYQIISQLRHVLIIFGGLVFFSEAITFAKVASIAIIIVGVIIAIYEKSTIDKKGVWYAFVSMFFGAVLFLVAKRTVADFSEMAFASFGLIAAGLLSLCFLRFSIPKVVNEIKVQRWWLVFAAALFSIFEFSLFTALHLGEASRVVPVTQSSLVFAVLGGIILLREHDHMIRKIIGMLVISFGIGILYFF